MLITKVFLNVEQGWVSRKGQPNQISFNLKGLWLGIWTYSKHLKIGWKIWIIKDEIWTILTLEVQSWVNIWKIIIKLQYISRKWYKKCPPNRQGFFQILKKPPKPKTLPNVEIQHRRQLSKIFIIKPPIMTLLISILLFRAYYRV